MDTRKFIGALLPVVAALLLTSCGSEDENEVTPTPNTEPTATVKSIPFTVTVNQGGTTRATVDDDLSTLHFAPGDKLYVEGENISGVLNLTTGEGAANGTFSGSLVYSGDEPSASLALSATLVSSEALECSFFTITGGKVTGFTYPTTKVCVANGESSAVIEAVKKYSVLTGSSTFGDKSFSLTQHTSFLNFTLTYTGAESGSNVAVTFTNAGATVCSGNVTLNEDLQANFVIPVASETKLNSASIALAGHAAKNFGGSTTLSGKVYNINKTFVRSAPEGVVGVQLWADGPYWATVNVGATQPQEYGLFFAWGETTGYSSVYANPMTDHDFSWENYELCNGTSNTLTKYNTKPAAGPVDNKVTLEAVDDAARANCGGNWRMPTIDDFNKLVSTTYTRKEWVVNYNNTGVSGYRFRGLEGSAYADNEIFLPAAGWRRSTSLYSQGSTGEYWSSSLYDNSPSYSRSLSFSKENGINVGNVGRYVARSVRPVHD